ncbi:GM10571 [Drosophila sechellia]|uniref:GM10571 n=1 Tax=Drosophila sechellia TaxID=7238 RepID=B4I4A6_DROSE|nr:GM10571 [Drosophila sechellia]
MEPQTNASCWAQIKWQPNTTKEQDEGWGLEDWGLSTADDGRRTPEVGAEMEKL